MPDTITNLFGCCCSEIPTNQSCYTLLAGIPWGFPKFRSAFDKTFTVGIGWDNTSLVAGDLVKYIAADGSVSVYEAYLTNVLPQETFGGVFARGPLGATTVRTTEQGKAYNFDPILKYAAVGAYFSNFYNEQSNTNTNGWRVNNGVSSFAVGDIVFRFQNGEFYGGNYYTLYSFYRCKVETAIAGDPAGLPDYFETYQGNRSIWLNTTWPTLANTAPTGIISYTNIDRYSTWTEVSNLYDPDDTLIGTWTRVAERDLMSGAITFTTDDTISSEEVYAIEAMPSFSNSARSTAYPDGFPEEYDITDGGDYVDYESPFNETWNVADNSDVNYSLRNVAFPGLPTYSKVVDITLSETEIVFTIEINVPWYRTEVRSYQRRIGWTTLLGTKTWHDQFPYTITSSTQYYKVFDLTQTVTVSALIDLDAYVLDLISLLPNAPTLGTYETYIIDSTGSASRYSIGTNQYSDGAVALFSNYILRYPNVAYHTGHAFGNYDDDFRVPENFFAIYRTKYRMVVDPHWTETLAVGGTNIETRYDTSPIEHTFAPTDSTIEWARVTTIDPSP